VKDSSLPGYLMVSEPGSFAEHTIRVRKPQILADVLATNDYSAAVVAALGALEREIRREPVAPLPEGAWGAEHWADALAPWRRRRWVELPWFLAETYFYRRVLEAVEYFRPGPGFLADPFAPQKRAALDEALPALCAFLDGLPSDADDEAATGAWLYRSLWGNRADLSNIAVQQGTRAAADHDPAALLVDHGRDACSLFAGGRVRRLDVACDNGGMELLSDLGLVDALLGRGLVREVRLHLKPQPYFVSDAMIPDCQETIRALRRGADAALRGLGERLAGYLQTGALGLRTDPFWATSHFFRRLPAGLRAEMSGADLLLLKGDVNYRRLLEDRHWPPTTRLEAVAGHMPAPFLALRTLKAELIVGLREGEAERLDAEDPDWRINGRRGVVHLVGEPMRGARRGGNPASAGPELCYNGLRT